MLEEQDIEKLRQQNAELQHALSRMVHWFGSYPELVPSVNVLAKMQTDLDKAKTLVSDTPTPSTDNAAIIEVAARIFNFKAHKQTEETKAEYIAFAKEMVRLHGMTDTTQPAMLAGDTRHPMQPLVKDDHDTVRFKANAIVKYLVHPKMNALAAMDFNDEDWTQVAQLIGYSLPGFSDLSYVSDADYARAQALPVNERE